MALTDIFTPGLATFIRDVGFPAFAFIVVLYLVNRMIKKDEKRQIQSDKTYKDLVEEFINKMETITKDHTDALRVISVSTKVTDSKVDVVTSEIRNNREICIRDRDRAMDRILEEITEVKDNIKKKYHNLADKDNDNVK